MPVNLASMVRTNGYISTARKFREFFNEIKRLGPNEIFSFGHLGDGNIHINIVSESNQDKLVNDVYELQSS